MPCGPVSMEGYTAFHAIDRALYSVLTTDLRRDPGESVDVMAFWILLERLGFFNFVRYMLSLEPSTVNTYADEAAACVRFIQTIDSDPDQESTAVFPATFKLLKGNISLQFLHQNRAALAGKLEEIVSRVCAKAFPDLVQQALKKQIEEEREKRTMFMTFSKGYPVGEEEAVGFFSSLFGDGCLESFHMVHPQAMYAFVVFSSVDVVDRILNGAKKAKFTVNGKHLWVRQHVPK